LVGWALNGLGVRFWIFCNSPYIPVAALSRRATAAALLHGLGFAEEP
jgi:hypothetical protein